MAKWGPDVRNTLSGVVGVPGVITAYLRDSLGSRRDSTSPALADHLREPWAEVRTASSVSELLLAFAVFPLVLVSIEATVDSRPWALPLTAESITEPSTAVLAFTSSFVHAGPTHLWGNVFGYLLIMSALYPLAVFSGKKRQLAAISVFNLLAIPLVTGHLSLLLPGTGATLGFSGVNAAFSGSLLLFVFFAWDTAGEINPVWSVAPALLSLALAVMIAPVIFPYVPSLGGYALVFGLSGGLVLAYFFHREGSSALRRFRLQENAVLYWGVAVLLLGFARLLVFVPANANLVSHLGGFYAGFFGLFALVVAEESQKMVARTAALGDGV